MNPRLFDTYVAVDWSAANAPTKGKDSIWIAAQMDPGASGSTFCENISTRHDALAFLATFLREQTEAGRRVLAGFDFAFGYPAGFAARVTGRCGWRAMWDHLDALVEDGPGNRSNRFEVGERLNQAFGEPVFWGKPHQHADRFADLPAKRPKAAFPVQRIVEGRVPQAKSVFQLAYNGAVGSQTLLGIAALGKLARATGAVVWPFETRFTDELPAAPSVVLAEIYPSLVLAKAPDGEVKDKAQVEAMVRTMATLDAEGQLRPCLEPPPGTTDHQRSAMIAEEGSIFGAGVLGLRG